MKELRGYTSEFKKVAAEARSLQERMTALYEDSGRVLGRYFEIKEFNQPDGLTTEPQRSQDELQVNARPGIREGGPGSGVKGHKSGQSTRPTGMVKRNNKTKKEYDTELATARAQREIDLQYAGDKEDSPYANEGRIRLKKLMEDVNSDYPGEDWVKLDVPMLRYDVALDFEKDLKKKGFTVKRHDWKERVQQGQEFSEFFVKKDDFDEANQYAVGAYPSYDNDARTEKE
jgi:hypothetical protein